LSELDGPSPGRVRSALLAIAGQAGQAGQAEVAGLGGVAALVAVAALAGLAALFLPWLDSGAVSRSAYGLVRAVDGTGLIDPSLVRVAEVVVVAVPVLVGLACAAVVLGYPWLVVGFGGCSSAFVLVGSLLALVDLGGEVGVGPWLGACIGAAGLTGTAGSAAMRVRSMFSRTALRAPSQRVARSRVRSVVTSLGALVLIGGGISTALVASSSSNGASTPSIAVVDLIDAVQNSDALGALDALDPAERDAIAPGLHGLESELERLGILEPNVGINVLSGLSFHLDHGTFTTHYVSADLAAVSVSGGTATTSVDPAALPLGPFVRKVAAKALTRQSVTRQSATRQSAVRRQPMPEIQLGTQRVAGAWYVSLGYTVGIDATLSERGTPVSPPAYSAAALSSAAGAPSAVAAARTLVSALSSFNLKALLGDLAPDEMAALDQYSPLFLPKAQRGLNALHTTVRVAISGVRYASAPLGDATLVKLVGGRITVTNGTTTYRVDHGCITVTRSSGSTNSCGSSGTAAEFQIVESLLPPPVQAIVKRLGSTQPNLGLVMVEEHGVWYLSPIRTILQSVDASLALLEPTDFTTIDANLGALKGDLGLLRLLSGTSLPKASASYAS